MGGMESPAGVAQYVCLGCALFGHPLDTGRHILLQEICRLEPFEQAAIDKIFAFTQSAISGFSP
jgi:hypothetical protein